MNSSSSSNLKNTCREPLRVEGEQAYGEFRTSRLVLYALHRMLGAALMKLLDCWSKRPPAPGMRYICDARGQKFWLETVDGEDTTYLSIAHHRKIVGRAIIVWEKPDAVLADIHIFTPKYRRRGVGKALIQEVVSLARQRTMERIVGRIDAHADVSLEYLYEWYERQGFEVNRMTAQIQMDFML